MIKVILVILSITSTTFITPKLIFSGENLSSVERHRARGPLKFSHSNPRYFADDTGQVIYLTGSHAWDSLGDWGGMTPDFDFPAFLDFLQTYNHNFIRLWFHEGTSVNPKGEFNISPLPWERTGPKLANDGKPKFDLTKFNTVFFERLRSRVIAARDRGIYVSIMLFNRFVYWPTHPFNSKNNINDLNADVNADGDGREFHTLAVPRITELQKSYVAKVIDTVNDLDNVLYEIGNEQRRDTIEWQYEMIKFIHSYEATLPKQHPVGMTSSGGGPNYPEAITNSELFHSPADWISPRNEPGQDYLNDPPAGEGMKVIITDTDHLWGVLTRPTAQWVWKSFLRGLNPILMDVVQNRTPGNEEEWNNPYRASLPTTRKAMGHTLSYARRINLATMIPHPNLSSTKYCLADPGVQYLVYIPSNGLIKGRGYRVVHWFSQVSHESRILQRLFQLIGLTETETVDLTNATGIFNIEWFNPLTGETIIAERRNGGEDQKFTAPFPADAVLYIYRD